MKCWVWILLLYFYVKPEAVAQELQPFMHPPRVIMGAELETSHLKSDRKFSGIPSIAISKEGTLWATWYTGTTPGEDANNYVVLACSKDHGGSWKEVLVIDPDEKGPVRAYDPEVWIDPNGKLWLFWAQTVELEGTIAGVWSIKTTTPDHNQPVWSKPDRLTNGVMMCKPTVLTSGEWLLPVSTWRLTDESAKVIASTDQGNTWKLRGACNVPLADREFDEHMLIERKDSSLWMLIRTRYGIGESTSNDKGQTWSALKPSNILHTSSRFFMRRLNSGNLLLVKHGPIKSKTGRSHLMAFISKDDGLSWSKGLLIDERTGISYPDGQQDQNGQIYLIYDYNRISDQQITMSRFTEEDIISEDFDTSMIRVFNERKIINKHQ